MKPIDVKTNSYVEYNIDSNEKGSKIQPGGHERTSKWKKFFAKAYTSN